MSALNLGLVIHNHQPVGQHAWVFEAIYEESYLPMLKALEDNPHVRLSLHYSGCLLDWIVPNRPEFVERLRALIDRGQVELLTGGYYEPILVSIPEADALAQVQRLTTTIEATFGVSARGLWLAERVWEPHLPSILSAAGTDWTVLDDTHFRLSGVPASELRGFYVTEDRGEAIKLLATSKPLRELIPWRDVSEVIAYLRAQAGDDDPLLVMGDDGEKFGSWPGTYEHVWTNGWMQRFLTALNENADWLTTLPAGEYVSTRQSRGRVYIPAASYEEMMEWALPAASSRELGTLRKQLAENDEQQIAAFVGGGLWRNFLTKYSEVNVLHKKVLRVHDKLARLERAYQRGKQLSGATLEIPISAAAPTKWTEMPPLKIGGGVSQRAETPLAEAWEHLWAAQCNCPYWHGVFGGIYLRDIRHALFKHAIQAEIIADTLIHRADWLELTATDHDRDGSDELLIESESANLYIAPEKGGAIFEWDVKTPAANLVTAIRRRPEAYHEAVRAAQTPAADRDPVVSIHEAATVLDESIAEALLYDWHERWCLVEHFLDTATSIDEFASGTYRDLGDFALQSFAWQRSRDRVVRLERQGTIKGPDEPTKVRLVKEIELSTDASVFVTYLLTHLDGPALRCIFGSEWNLSPLLFGEDYSPTITLNEKLTDLLSTKPLQEPQVDQLAAESAALGMSLHVEAVPPADLWAVPVEAASASEKGFERTYQGQCLYLCWPLGLEIGATARFGLTWSPSTLNH